MKKRNELIDILKGIAICLIVLGHTSFVGKTYIYLFHVAVFIIASGMFYNGKKITTLNELIEFIKKKLLRLYVPYVIINIIYLSLNNILLDTHIYSIETHNYYNLTDYGINIVKILLFRGVTELGGATWFLHLLFLISIGYAIFTFILNRIFLEKYNMVKIAQCVLSIFYLIVGFVISNIDHYDIFDIYVITLNCYWLFFIGNIFNDYKGIIKKNKWSYLILLVNILLLIFLNDIGAIEISKNVYTSPLFFFTCSVIGWMLLYILSLFIEKKKIGKLFSFIGQESIYILLFHFVGFKIVNFLIYCFVNHDINYVSGFPVSGKGLIYSIIYFVFGIAISLLLNNWFKSIKNVFKEVRRSI